MRLTSELLRLHNEKQSLEMQVQKRNTSNNQEDVVNMDTLRLISHHFANLQKGKLFQRMSNETKMDLNLLIISREELFQVNIFQLVKKDSKKECNAVLLQDIQW